MDETIDAVMEVGKMLPRARAQELEEMAKKITGIVEQFITYDIETTNTGILKGFDKQRENEQNGSRFVI